MSRPTYRDYRRWGHTRFHAATLAIPLWVLILTPIAAGIVLGRFL